jgi:hypothetical protein
MMAAGELDVVIEIVCEALPGLAYEGRAPLHLGIQQDAEIIQAAPADRDRIVFRPAFRVRKHSDGSANLLGPFAHGPRAERFIYLNWIVIQGGTRREHIGRIKLHLNHIRYEDAENAAARGTPIKVTLQLTNQKGKPVFASVRANQAQWQL